jgi:hypothetical protein
MKWMPVTKESDCPPDDSFEDYPMRYIVRGKMDGSRGAWDVYYSTAADMWETVLIYDYAEYLDQSHSPDPDILVKTLEECFAPGNLTVIGTMPSLYVEKLRLAYDEYKTALNQYKNK